MVANAAHGSKR
jgi:NAD(P)H-dependent flavin oxidoreductase YrpB (nitropropane dioxygenase family)